MVDLTIVLPSKPKIISEEEFKGVYEIDGLYPGYGHTLGNSLRRIILSSLSGASVTAVKIDGVSHEFSTMNGVKEDVITIILNLKKLRVRMVNDEPVTLTIKAKGVKTITAGDIVGGGVEILNKDLVIAELTSKDAVFDAEITLEKGMGFVAKEDLKKERVDIGTIYMDAIFTPIRRVNYEVENMRVGDRTDFNKIRFSIETDGTLTPKEALEKSITIMINQLKAIVGFVEEEVVVPEKKEVSEKEAPADDEGAVDSEVLKTRIENLDLSSRTLNALSNGNIRTLGGLARKKASDLEEIAGLGPKGIVEIKEILAKHGIELK